MMWLQLPFGRGSRKKHVFLHLANDNIYKSGCTMCLCCPFFQERNKRGNISVAYKIYCHRTPSSLSSSCIFAEFCLQVRETCRILLSVVLFSLMLQTLSLYTVWESWLCTLRIPWHIRELGSPCIHIDTCGIVQNWLRVGCEYSKPWQPFFI